LPPVVPTSDTLNRCGELFESSRESEQPVAQDSPNTGEQGLGSTDNQANMAFVRIVLRKEFPHEKVALDSGANSLFSSSCFSNKQWHH
jgi:hypothetical protein